MPILLLLLLLYYLTAIGLTPGGSSDTRPVRFNEHKDRLSFINFGRLSALR
jgi:hypothetical protein